MCKRTSAITSEINSFLKIAFLYRAISLEQIE